MKRLMVLITVASMMAASMVVFAGPASAASMGDTTVNCGGAYASANDCADFYNGFGGLLGDLCAMGDKVACGDTGPEPFAVNDPNSCPAGTTWAPTADPKYGGAKYVCE